MNLEELIFVKESLEELEPNVEKFCWGPTLGMAEERQKEALRILRKAIKEATKAGSTLLKQATEYEKLKDEIEDFIAAHELINPHYLTDDQIIAYFDFAKEKHVKRALKELR